MRVGKGVVAFLLLVGLVQAADDLKEPLKSLQGNWAFQLGDDSGKFKFEADKVTIEVSNGSFYVARVKIDDAADPKTIDFMIEEGPDNAAGKTAYGLLKRDGDKFVIAVAPHGLGERPKNFEPIDGEVFVFKLARQ